MTIALDVLAGALGDRYRIERQLGAGGMATVYLARDLKHDREVALKVLRPELGAVLGPDRFLAEIRITARLDHPHILTLIDSGSVGGFLYYVLPVVRGESLRVRLEREKQLALDDALAITTQVASALDYAHRQGVIHRDIKPENILLHEGEAVLTDFGIALAVREAGGNRLTETGLSLGTPQYMSPEQATGDRALDARSDIYSLAAVLYEMLAGEPPITGPNAQAVIAKLMTERPVRLGVVRGTVPEAVDAAIARALIKVPADRFATAGEFARALAAPTVASRGRADSRSRWLTVAAAATGVGVLVIATVATLRSRSPAVPPFAPQFEQLTTDGNARRAAISPDGTRLAYVASDCDERERCTERLVVGDIGNAAAVTLLKGRSIQGPTWAADGRFLVAGLIDIGSSFTTVKTVVVSALGGPARLLLGYGSGVIGTTDTVIVSDNIGRGTDSVGWLRLVTVSDGLVRDSIPVRSPIDFYVAYPAPKGGRIALFGFTSSGTALRLLDRTGRITDSLPTFPSTLETVQWTPKADAVVLQVDLREGNLAFVGPGTAPVPTVLVRYPVSAQGTFLGRPDTLMTLERGTQLSKLRPDGSALLSKGPVEAMVFAVERSGPGQLDFHTRRLAGSTAGMNARLSRDGATVWLKHGGSGPGSRQRNTFLPFEGGSERPFDLPLGAEMSVDWSRPASSTLLYAYRDSSGQARLAEIDVATGRPRRSTSIAPQTSFVFSIPHGGYGLGAVNSGSARIVDRPGKPDTVWTTQRKAVVSFTVPGDVSADGRAFYEFAQKGETVWVRKIPLDGSVPSPTTTLVVDKFFGSLSDGSYETIRTDSVGGLQLYRAAAGSRQSVRLGAMPIQGAGTEWANSDDGRRFVVVKPVNRPDIYLFRNFGDLLKR